MEPARQAGSERRRDCDPSFENATWRGRRQPTRSASGRPSPAVGGRNATNCGLAQKIGMSAHAERIAAKDIDAGVLRELTDQDLKDLGVSRSSAQDAPRVSAALRLP